MDAESIDGLALTARRAAQELVGVLVAVAVGLSHDGVGRGEVGVVVVQVLVPEKLRRVRVSSGQRVTRLRRALYKLLALC